METARVLALRGHKPTIFEKTDRLGGVFIAAAAPSFKRKTATLSNGISADRRSRRGN
ncbi:MAG: hypothetical protein ACLUSP_04030 [Christensenellales bacterium]